MVSTSRFQTDGIRPQSAADKTQFNARLDTSPRDGQHLMLVASDINVQAQDPGGVTPADWRANPRTTAQGALNFNARKDTRQTQLGLAYDVRVDAQNTLRLMAYAGQRRITTYQSTPVAAQTPATSAGAGSARHRRVERRHSVRTPHAASQANSVMCSPEMLMRWATPVARNTSQSARSMARWSPVTRAATTPAMRARPGSLAS